MPVPASDKGVGNFVQNSVPNVFLAITLAIVHGQANPARPAGARVAAEAGPTDGPVKCKRPVVQAVPGHEQEGHLAGPERLLCHLKSSGVTHNTSGNERGRASSARPHGFAGCVFDYFCLKGSSPRSRASFSSCVRGCSRK